MVCCRERASQEERVSVPVSLAFVRILQIDLQNWLKLLCWKKPQKMGTFEDGAKHMVGNS